MPFSYWLISDFGAIFSAPQPELKGAQRSLRIFKNRLWLNSFPLLAFKCDQCLLRGFQHPVGVALASFKCKWGLECVERQAVKNFEALSKIQMCIKNLKTYSDGCPNQDLSNHTTFRRF